MPTHSSEQTSRGRRAGVSALPYLLLLLIPEAVLGQGPPGTAGPATAVLGRPAGAAQEGVPPSVPHLEDGHRRLAELQATGGLSAGLPRARTGEAYVVGQTRNFWAVDFTQGSSFPYRQYELQAVCRAVGEYAYYFVESTYDSLNQSTVDDFVEAFEQATPGSPRDAAKGIYEHETEVFGPVPDEDGDPKVVILFLNIRDGATTPSTPYYAGLFYAANQYADPVDFGGGVKQRSSETEMLYVDIFPADPTGPTVLSTIAHEFQHLIQWGNDPQEITAVNEGLSEYASFLCGFGLRGIAPYVTRPNVDLFSWRAYGSTLGDYSRMALWSYYLGRRFGDALISQISTSPLIGKAGVDAALATAGTDFASVLPEFAASLWLDDPSVNDGRYAARPLRPWIEPVVHENLYPSARSVLLQPNGTTVIRYWNGADLDVSFPDGLPAGVSGILALKGAGGADALDVSGSGISTTGFGATWREGALILANAFSAPAGPFRVSATATQGDTGLVKFDTGAPFVRILMDPTWLTATRFRPEVAPSRLAGIWVFYNRGDEELSEDAHLEVRLANENIGNPGQWIINETPIFEADATPPFQNEGWLYIPVTVPLAPQGAGVEYLVSIDMEDKLIAYQDRTRKANRSYIWRGPGTGWEPAQNFSILGGQVILNGDWMFRAEFAYTDSTAPTIQLALLQHPIFPTQADVYVLGSEPLHPGLSSGTLTQTGMTPVNLLFDRTVALDALVDPAPVLAASGSVDLDVTAWDRYGGHSVTGMLDVAVRSLAPGASATLETGRVGRLVRLEIPVGDHDGAFLTLAEYEEVPRGIPGAPLEGAGAGGSPIVVLGPAGWTAPSEGARIEFPLRFPLPDGAYRIERWEEMQWTPVPGGMAALTSGSAQGRVFAGGWYRLARGRAPAAAPGSSAIELLGNAPNPFNPETVIRFRLPLESAAENVRLTVLNTRGQRVDTLLDRVMGAGEHEITWRGTDASGRPVASGIYLYRLEVAGQVFTRKMLLLR